MRFTRFFLLALLAAAPLHAKECTVATAEAADEASDSWRDSWHSVFAGYEQYQQCDQGAPAEGFSDSIVHLLATQWGSLHEAQRFIARRPSFKDFVLRHIDATANYYELVRVERSSKSRCPRSAKLLCKEIAVAAKGAIAEINR